MIEATNLAIESYPSIVTIKIALDIDQAKQIIKDCLDPGAVLLPISAVEELRAAHGLSLRHLVKCGAIVAEEVK